MDICLGPGGLCIFIQICLHSWMRNKFLYCTIVCDKSHTLFSSSPASYSISLEKQGNLSRKMCREVKITPGKRLKLAHLLITLMRVTMPSLLWWKKMRTDDGKSHDSMWWTGAHCPSFYSSQMMCQIRQAQLTYWGFLCLLFLCTVNMTVTVKPHCLGR